MTAVPNIAVDWRMKRDKIGPIAKSDHGKGRYPLSKRRKPDGKALAG